MPLCLPCLHFVWVSEAEYVCTVHLDNGEGYALNSEFCRDSSQKRRQGRIEGKKWNEAKARPSIFGQVIGGGEQSGAGASGLGWGTFRWKGAQVTGTLMTAVSSRHLMEGASIVKSDVVVFSSPHCGIVPNLCRDPILTSFLLWLYEFLHSRLKLSLSFTCSVFCRRAPFTFQAVF